MDMNKKEILVAVSVVVGSALLVAFLKGRGGSASAPSSSGAAALVGGYTTAETVYVPTTSYDIHYDTNEGTIVNATAPSGQPTTIYMPGSSNNTHTTTTTTTTSAPPPIVMFPDPVTPRPPIITTTGHTQSHPIQTAPTHPKPVIHKAAPKPVIHKAAPKPVTHKAAPKPKAPVILSFLQKAGKQKAPRGGWNHGSVVDLLKANGDNSSFDARKKLAEHAGISHYTGSASQNVTLLHKLEGAGLHY